MSPSVSEVLNEAREAGVEIALDNTGNVQLSGPRTAITKCLTNKLRECKSELIAYLSKPERLRDIDEDEIAMAYEMKATLSGQIPPLQQVQEREAWLATIDWWYGLRCGITGLQCVLCKGVPCNTSTQWPRPSEKRY